MSLVTLAGLPKTVRIADRDFKAPAGMTPFMLGGLAAWIRDNLSPLARARRESRGLDPAVAAVIVKAALEVEWDEDVNARLREDGPTNLGRMIGDPEGLAEFLFLLLGAANGLDRPAMRQVAAAITNAELTEVMEILGGDGARPTTTGEASPT